MNASNSYFEVKNVQFSFVVLIQRHKSDGEAPYDIERKMLVMVRLHYYISCYICEISFHFIYFVCFVCVCHPWALNRWKKERHTHRMCLCIENVKNLLKYRTIYTFTSINTVLRAFVCLAFYFATFIWFLIHELVFNSRVNNTFRPFQIESNRVQCLLPHVAWQTKYILEERSSFDAAAAAGDDVCIFIFQLGSQKKCKMPIPNSHYERNFFFPLNSSSS